MAPARLHPSGAAHPRRRRAQRSCKCVDMQASEFEHAFLKVRASECKCAASACTGKCAASAWICKQVRGHASNLNLSTWTLTCKLRLSKCVHMQASVRTWKQLLGGQGALWGAASLKSQLSCARPHPRRLKAPRRAQPAAKLQGAPPEGPGGGAVDIGPERLPVSWARSAEINAASGSEAPRASSRTGRPECTVFTVTGGLASVQGVLAVRNARGARTRDSGSAQRSECLIAPAARGGGRWLQTRGGAPPAQPTCGLQDGWVVGGLP